MGVVNLPPPLFESPGGVYRDIAWPSTGTLPEPHFGGLPRSTGTVYRDPCQGPLVGHTGNHFWGVLLAGVVQTRGLVPKLANWSSKGLLVYRDIARPLPGHCQEHGIKLPNDPGNENWRPSAARFESPKEAKC